MKCTNETCDGANHSAPIELWRELQLLEKQGVFDSRMRYLIGSPCTAALEALKIEYESYYGIKL